MAGAHFGQVSLGVRVTGSSKVFCTSSAKELKLEVLISVFPLFSLVCSSWRRHFHHLLRNRRDPGHELSDLGGLSWTSSGAVSSCVGQRQMWGSVKASR